MNSDIQPLRGNAINSGKVLILTLGILGVLPGILLGSLSSTFIDSVLVEKDYDRVFPIILCYFIFTVMSFALDYSWIRMLIEHAKRKGHAGNKYFTSRIHAFAIILNALIVILLDRFILIPCAVLLLVIFAVIKYYTEKTSKNISNEAVVAIQTILKICMLFVSGLFVMRSRITIGELYAIALFSGAIFTGALAMMPQKSSAKKENAGGEEGFPLSPIKPVPFIKSIMQEKKMIVLANYLALIGMLSEGIILFVQRINLRDCIPSGDWNNLLRNCLFMCGAITFGFFAKKGNNIGFQQIFHGKVSPYIEQRLKVISRLVLTILFAVYYGIQIHSYNSTLASQMTIASLIVCVVFISLLTEERRKAWGEDFGKLYDMLSKLIFGCVTAYIYCSLALRVTEIAVGDLFVFLIAVQGLFLGMGAISKTALIVINAKKQQYYE